MDNNTEQAKNEIISLLSQIYGQSVGDLFQSKHKSEVIPTFVHNSYLLLKQNMGGFKASEQLDKILNKHNLSVSSYD